MQWGFITNYVFRDDSACACVGLVPIRYSTKVKFPLSPGSVISHSQVPPRHPDPYEAVFPLAPTMYPQTVVPPKQAHLRIAPTGPSPLLLLNSLRSLPSLPFLTNLKPLAHLITLRFVSDFRLVAIRSPQNDCSVAGQHEAASKPSVQNRAYRDLNELKSNSFLRTGDYTSYPKVYGSQRYLRYGDVSTDS